MRWLFLPSAVGVGGFVLPVPQRAADHRSADVAVLEHQQDLVADLGQREPAAILAGADRDPGAPPGVLLDRHRRDLDLDPAQLGLVLDVGDEADHRIVDAAGIFLGDAGLLEEVAGEVGDHGLHRNTAMARPTSPAAGGRGESRG